PADPSAQIPSYGANASKQQIGEMLDAAARKYGIPPDILKAIAYKESRWNPGAVGDGGKSFGIGQIYTTAHPDYDVNRGRQDIAYQIDYMARFLSNLYKQTGDWRTAIRRYNGSGPMAERYADDVVNNLLNSKPWQREFGVG
ncbi:MAG: transglycosylase SLT domain-containing protein, partial [Candidatus Eremiobacterota bacterium]